MHIFTKILKETTDLAKLKKYIYKNHIHLTPINNKNKLGFTPLGVVYSLGITKDQVHNYELMKEWIDFFNNQSVNLCDINEVKDISYFLLPRGMNQSLIQFLSSNLSLSDTSKELIEEYKKNFHFREILCDKATRRGDINVIDFLNSVNPLIISKNSLAEKLFQHADKDKLQSYFSNLNMNYEFGAYSAPSYPSIKTEVAALIFRKNSGEESIKLMHLFAIMKKLVVFLIF